MLDMAQSEVCEQMGWRFDSYTADCFPEPLAEMLLVACNQIIRSCLNRSGKNRAVLCRQCENFCDFEVIFERIWQRSYLDRGHETS